MHKWLSLSEKKTQGRIGNQSGLVMQDSQCLFERMQKGPAIVLLLASVLSSFATDPVVELWEGQHDLTEKRLASVLPLFATICRLPRSPANQ